MIQQWADYSLKVLAIDHVDFGRDTQRHPRATGDADGGVGAFLRRNTAEEQEGRARARLERAQVRGQPVVYRGRPMDVGQMRALRVADRHQRYLGILAVDRTQVRDVEPPVQGDDGRGSSKARQRQSEIVGVAVDDVKLL